MTTTPVRPASSISVSIGPMRRFPSMFRFLLKLEDGDPNDPAVLVTAVPNWTVGETFSTGRGHEWPSRPFGPYFNNVTDDNASVPS